MFKRSNRAKMLALVAALGTVGSNINSNAGAANANSTSSLSEKIFTGVGGFALGGLTVALLAKFTGLGSKLVSSPLKSDKAALVRYFKYLISKGKIDKLRFRINDGRVIVEEVSNLNDLNLNQEVVKILENNNDLKDDALFVAQKKWSDLIVDSCMVCLIEARKLADLKHPTGCEYDVTVTIDGGSTSCDVNGFKINKENDAMDTKAKELNDFVKKVQDTVEEFTIVQAFKEATLEFEKETPKEKK